MQCEITALLHFRDTQKKKVGTEGYFRKEREGLFQSLIFFSLTKKRSLDLLAKKKLSVKQNLKLNLVL